MAKCTDTVGCTWKGISCWPRNTSWIAPYYRSGRYWVQKKEKTQKTGISQTLKIGKACSDDGITHQMLKSTSETICIPLAIIFNFSLQKGIFPSTWKIARVMPAFKKDDKSSPSNYRPISLLSCIGKVMERASIHIILFLNILFCMPTNQDSFYCIPIIRNVS